MKQYLLIELDPPSATNMLNQEQLRTQVANLLLVARSPGKVTLLAASELYTTVEMLESNFPDRLRDWEHLGKRLIALGQLGLRLDQHDGHLYIHEHRDADLYQGVLGTSVDCLKEYSSFKTALNRVDNLLKEAGKPSLLQVFKDSVDYYDDLGVVFGARTQ